MDKPPPDQSGGEWRLVPYIAPNGKSQVLEFLDGYRRSDFDGHVHLYEVAFGQLKLSGPFTGPPYWEPLGGGLGEIRSRRCRIYCAVLSARRILMLMGVIKRWRRFSHRSYCETCKADAESRAYDQEQREYLYKLHCQRRRANGP